MSKKIKITQKYNQPDITETVAEHVERKLYDHDAPGALEQALSNAEKAHVGLANLCQVLADKGLLSAVDITSVVDGWDCDVELVELIHHE